MRTRTLDVGLAALSVLDLSQVKRKIMEPDPEGKGWTQAQADEAEKWYRHFLELCLRYPNMAVVPNNPIDQMWHQHILDTRAYARDCDAIYGHMLHHFPYFGMNGDAPERDDSFDRTNELYMLHFGEKCTNMPSFRLRTAVPEDCTLHPQGVACGSSKCSGNSCRDESSCSQSNCNGSGKLVPETAMNCGHGGGGTGCGQGCRRGGLVLEAAGVLVGPEISCHCQGGGGSKCGSSCGRGK